MQLSIVIPAFNEEESIPSLVDWIEKVMQDNQFDYEVWFIDDGSKDATWEEIQRINKKNERVKGIKFQRNYGKAAALHVGFQKAQGDVVITMDADLQDSPDEIPELYRMITEDGFDLVSGWKQKRYDPITKTVPTKLYNGVTRMMSGIKLHDMNCGLKAYRKDVVKSVEVYGDMHRYIPVLAKKAGFSKIGEKVVQHQARQFGTTKFGIERFINGPLDLMSVLFMTRFGKRPMHVFGFLGGLMFLLGFLFTFWVLLQKALFVMGYLVQKPPLVADNVIFYLALTAMMIGTQLFLAGFIGELIARSSSDRNNYLLEQILE